jgi:hypothetical protein
MNPHDQPGYMRPVTHVTDERRNLLLEKRELLHSMSGLALSYDVSYVKWPLRAILTRCAFFSCVSDMHDVVLREERLLRAFGSVSAGSTRRSLPVSDSRLSTSSSSCRPSMSRCYSPTRTSVSATTSSSMATFYTTAHNTRFAHSKPQRNPATRLPRLPIAAL